MNKTHLITVLLVLAISGTAKNIYVNNESGSNSFNGLAAVPSGDGQTGPVASIDYGISLLQTSDVMEVANTGKPYQQPYPGETDKPLYVNTGGTFEKPLVINGNGAVISGLAVIPENKWTRISEGIFSLPFWPMSNMYKGYKQQNYWLDGTHIWWVDGQAAPNCKSLEELRKTPGGFWWNKAQKQVLFNLPDGKQFKDLKIELPANSGFYIFKDHTIIKNFIYIFSWDDGFDIAEDPKNAIYKNCVAIDNCGQGFSCHTSGIAYYEDCVAIRCASSGSCDVHWCNSSYVRCIFMNNTFEAGIYAADESIHSYNDCLIVANEPFEQIWQRGNSKMNFNNCVIVGCGNDKAILDVKSGSVLFRNCTIMNADRICNLNDESKFTLCIENCVLANMKSCCFNFPGNTARFSFYGNIYMNAPGNILNGKTFGKTEWTEYLNNNNFEKWSEWSDLNLTGALKSELPQTIKLKNRYGTLLTVGAALPAAVWQRYFELLKVRATPAGVVMRK